MIGNWACGPTTIVPTLLALNIICQWLAILDLQASAYAPFYCDDDSGANCTMLWHLLHLD